MVRLIFFVSLCSILFTGTYTWADFAIQNQDRVVFFGDSITAGSAYPNYPRYLETYLRTRFPDRNIQFWNRGWSGDVAANLTRFKRDCLSLQPTVIFICMGMNDAAYKPEIASGLSAFMTNLKNLVEAARSINPAVRIYLVSPILYEFSVTHTRAFYPYVLWCYAREEKDLANRLNVGFIDLNREYGRSIGLAHGMFPRTLLFSGDSIHPIPNGGHLFIALHILRALGADPQLATLTIDNGKIVAESGQTATVIKQDPDEIQFERKLDSLPMPAVSLYKEIPYQDRKVAFLECMPDEFNRDILQVRNLPAPTYRLSIDDQVIGNFSKEELAEGINLSRFQNTPDFQQADAVQVAVGEKQILQDSFWRNHLKQPPSPDQEKAFQDELNKQLSAIRKAAEPKPHRITLVKTDEPSTLFKHYQQFPVVTVPSHLPVDNSSPKQEIPVTLKNIGESPLQLELFWNDRSIQPSFRELNLKPDETQKIVFTASLTVSSSVPELVVTSRSENSLFPTSAQEFSIPLRPTWQVPITDKTITVDGNLNDWTGIPAFPLSQRLSYAAKSRTFGPDDLSADAWVSRDPKFLYFAVSVQDQDAVNHYTDNRIGWDDAIHFSIGNPAMNFCLALTPDGPKMDPPPVTPFPFAIRRIGLQTVYEWAIPRSEIKGCKAESGNECPFNLTVNDRDRDDSCKSLTLSGSGPGGNHVPGTLSLR